MPLVRLQVGNVYGLRQTELHRNVDREDPKANLEGLAASGLVGILRQIGDLAEFAAEIFQGIQEEVMITASRSNNLKMRLKQIEVTVPSIQKSVLAQPNHIQFAYTGGLEWHPRIPNVQNHFIHDDLPQFIMGPYEDCRDPPRLHLLDKFDVNGAGSCLKRYSDPTHFKRPSKLPEIEKKKCVPQSRDISRSASMVNQSDSKTFRSLSLGGRTSCSKTASTNGIESKTDLQDLGSCSLDSASGAEKPKGFTRTIASVLSESESGSESDDANDSPSQDETPRGSSWEKCATDEAPTGFVLDTLDNDKTTNGNEAEREAVQDVKTREIEMDNEDETESEGDDFVDALYTIDSESETDQEVHAPSKPYSAEQETGMNSNSLRDDDETTSNGTRSYSNGFSNPLYDTIQETQDETCCDTKIWSNGNLPEIVAENAPFDWFTWSPQLDHMKISFNPSETLPSSELKLKLRDEYTVSSFQLVPEATDSDKETSSSYSDNHSEQQWGERKNQQELYDDSLDRINAETSNGYGKISYLQNPAEPLPPPLPPLEWMVSNNKLKNSLSTIKKEIPNFVIASDPKPLNDGVVHLKNNVREFCQSHGNEKQMEAGDFLHQIRTKQFNLRRVVTARTSSSEATTNANIGRILEKANSIRQAVASDNGDSESNTWSDSDG